MPRWPTGRSSPAMLRMAVPTWRYPMVATKRTNQAGFTLIELVIVIVILGILAAVAIPKYEDMREQARVATLKGELGSIRSAIAIQYARNALNGAATFPTLN